MYFPLSELPNDYDSFMPKSSSVAIVGSGFFGMTSALYLAKRGHKVEIYERNSEAMQEASLFNQARVHGGYHYPRSLSTAARCRANYDRFVHDFQSAIFDDFRSIYAVAENSKVNFQKYSRLMGIIGAPIERLSGPLRNEFDYRQIAEVYVTQEVAFNSTQLLILMMEQLAAYDVKIYFSEEVTRVENFELMGKEGARLKLRNGNQKAYDSVILTTYGLDEISSNFEFKANYLYEVCELVRVEVPMLLRDLAVTVMDGPYWSLTPWPAFENHVLTHVRYTPHGRFDSFLEAKEYLQQKPISRSDMILRDAARFMARIAECSVLGSEYTIKTVLRKRDTDDARPVYVQTDNRILSLLGGKIDNVYEVENVLESFIGRLL
jgi:hypothetical protein